jgi:flavin-dependent dehydrogenase
VLYGERDQPGVNQNYTYHVDRGRFDLLLLQHLHQFGAQVYEGGKVVGADTCPKHATIQYDIGRRQVGTRVRFVVDASRRRTRPQLYERLRAATQLRLLKEEGDYSYEMSQLAADRLVLVGDAVRFVDPIFSTGVSIALNSSRFAAHKTC